MTYSVDAVIGAGFGDEGKGLTTDYLAHRYIQKTPNVVVVRYNSSAQAGHTVTTDNARHVFHHWGSGALAGAATHLGPHFAIHPMLFREETEQLRLLGARLDLTVDPRCPVTLPFDMAINQALEQSRGALRHGSCGVGFGETLERHQHAAYALCVGEISTLSEVEFQARIDQMLEQYVPQRLKQLDLNDALPQALYQADFWARYWQDVQLFLAQAHIVNSENLSSWDHIIFEGAQGLRLDEELGDFPHVTRSKTGLPWIIEIMEEGNLHDLNVYYATRSYVTRHGAGPLPNEKLRAPELFEDATNQPNTWQGTLRFAPLDEQVLADFIQRDLHRVDQTRIQNFGIMVSCLDHWEDRIWTLRHQHHRDNFGKYLQALLKGAFRLESFGPTRSTMRSF